MFGVILRAAGTGALMTILAAVLGRILTEVIPIFNAPDSMLAQTFNAVDQFALLIGLLSTLIMIASHAVVESEVPR